MISQLKVEFYKLKTFLINYIAVLLMFAAGFPYGYLKFRDTLNTNEVFASVICDTSLLFLISVVAAWFISADFGNRTITNELKLGYSRLSVILSRTIVVSVQSVLLHSTYVVATILGFSAAHRFDASVFCGENAVWMTTVMLQLIAIESVIILICFAVKKPAGAVSISVIYTFIFCNILRNFVSSKIFTLSCFCFAQNPNAVSLASCAVSSLVTATIFITASALIFHSAEVK